MPSLGNEGEERVGRLPRALRKNIMKYVTYYFLGTAPVSRVAQSYISSPNSTPYAVYVGSRESIVGIATGYGLDDRGVGVRVPVGSRIISSPRRPDRLWGPPNLLSNWYRGSFPGGKAAGACGWPLTSNECRGQEYVDLYIHSPYAFMAQCLISYAQGQLYLTQFTLKRNLCLFKYLYFCHCLLLIRQLEKLPSLLTAITRM
jgi:hypothetical protein